MKKPTAPALKDEVISIRISSLVKTRLITRAYMERRSLADYIRIVLEDEANKPTTQK